MAVRDYYETLGVARTASAEEIKSAYKRLARKYHPDLNPGDQKAEARFKEISEAYAVLGDPKKKKEYDRSGGRGFSSGFDAEEFLRTFRAGRFSFGGLGGFGDIFGDIFSGMGFPHATGPYGPQPAPVRGADLRASLRVEFEQAARGAEVPLEVARRVACPACRGQGTSGTQTCASCGGTGQQAFSRGEVHVRSGCRTCGGTGRASLACRSCDGRGTIPRLQRVKVKVPEGVQDGSTIRLPGLGEEGEQGGSAGDLYIDIQVGPHPWFRRRGADIEIDLPVSVSEAVNGARIRVPTLDGWATVKLPPGTSSGRRLRLRGKGVASSRGGSRGDQHAVVQIVLPGEIDERSRELLREFERRNPGPLEARRAWEKT